MNVPALLTMAVLVGWLATLITHAETDDVSLPDFAMAVCAAALAGGLLAPVLGVSATGEFGLTLSGTLFSWACATLLLGTLNLLRFGSLLRNRRARDAWCPRSESNRHAFTGGGFSCHFGFRRPGRKHPLGFVVWSTPSPWPSRP